MKKLFKKHWPLIVIGALLLVVGIYLSGAREKQGIKQVVEADPEAEEGVKLKNIHYTQKDPDKNLTWLLDAKEVTFSENRQIMTFSNFRLRLEAKDRPTIELEGKRGDYNKETEVITLQGDLLGTMEDGYKIITDRAVYKGKEGYLTSDAPVTIHGPLFSIQGVGLYFNPEKETLKIGSDVITSIHDKELFL